MRPGKGPDESNGNKPHKSQSMKETIHAKIGREAFTLDTDAYEALKRYFDDIRGRLQESPDETMEEIEGRIGELLREQLTSPMQVTTLDMARKAMARMGAPEEFGERNGPRTEETEPRRLLRRPRPNRSIAGVCAGIASFFDVDVTLVRLVTLFLILFGGMSLWVYIILWIVIPNEPEQ